jgi:TniQ
MKTLLNKVIPKPNESLYSIFYRVARANYFEHLGSMLRHIATDIYVTNCNYIDEKLVKASILLELGSMSNIEVEKYILNKYNHLLVNSVNFPTETSANFQSHRVYQKYDTKFCPLCIQEDFYHRLEWDISLVTMCHKHQVKLIDSCPNCKGKILLNRFMRNECKCGFNFLQTKKYMIEENELVRKAQNAIYQYLMGKQSQEFEGEEFLAKDYFFFLFQFCFMMDNKETEKFPSFKGICLDKRINFLCLNSEKRDVNMMRFITSLAHFLTVKPDKYLNEILRVWVETKDISVNSYRSDYKYLKDILNHEKGLLYQTAYDNYLLEQKNVYVNGNSLFKGNLQDKKYITRLEAFKMIKTEWKTLQNLCNYGLLTLHKTKKRDREIHLIEKDSVENYLKMKRESMTLNQVTNYLGVNFRIVTELVERGYLKALHGPKKDGYPIWYFKREEVEEFLNRFMKKSIKELDKIDSQWICFEKANYLLRAYDINTLDLIELLLEGVFRFAILKDKRNIKGILVFEEDLNQYIDSKKLEIIEQYGFRVKQLSKIFRVGEIKIRRWIQEGMLTVTHEKMNQCGNVSRYVSIEQVKQLLMEMNEWDESATNEYLKNFLEKKYF